MIRAQPTMKDDDVYGQHLRHPQHRIDFTTYDAYEE